MTFSCTEEILKPDVDNQLKSKVIEKEAITAAKDWFYTNPEKNNYHLLEYVDSIKWESASVFSNDTAKIVEVQLKLKSKFQSKIKGFDKLNLEQRLLIIIKNNVKYSLLEFLVSEEETENLKNQEKINYSNLNESFEGTLLLVNCDQEVKVINFINEKEKSEANLKSAEHRCVCIFAIYSDGTKELVSILYCYLRYTDEEGGEGTSGSGATSDCNCNICPDCGGCLDQPQLKSLPYPGDGETQEGSISCPACNCPKIDVSGIENNEKVMCIFQNLIKTATIEYNPLVTSFLMNFSDDVSVNPNDIIFNLSSMSGVYGECDATGSNYVITLNSNEINNRAPIEIAKTFIHEILHALIANKLNLAPGNFVTDFSNYINANGLNQHQLMMDHYVEPMVNFLKDYDSLSGNIASDSYYRSLALSGLESVISNEEMNSLINAQNYFRQRGLTCN